MTIDSGPFQLVWRRYLGRCLPLLVPSSRGRPTHYLLAIALTALATGIRLTIAPQTGGLQFVTFFPAVTLTAIFGGIGPAALSAILCSCIANYLFMQPINSIHLSLEALWSGLVFLVDEIIVCGAITAMQRYYRVYVATYDELMHSRVAETLLREKAQRANHDLRTSNKALNEAIREADRRASRAELAESQLEKALSELHAIFDTVPASIFIAHDPDCRVMTGNRASYRLLQAPMGSNISKSSALHAEATPFSVFKDGLPVAPHDLPVQRAALGEDVYDEELELRFDNGGSAWLFGNASTLRDKNGAPRGALGAFIDITQLKENERSLQAARREAERANTAKSRFLAATSHDLRQPLQALNLQIDLLSRKFKPLDTPLLNKMEYCLFSMNELLSDMLDLSKLDAQAILPKPTDFPVQDILAALVAIHLLGAEKKNIRLRLVPSRLTARTDRGLMERILGNLLSNAVRYTHRGGIVVGCRRRQGKVWVEIHDTGIGIPLDKTNEIFEEFKQLGNPERNREKGSGLGLAIVKRTADLLGLEIQVSSRTDSGSSFMIELPVVDAQPSPLPQSAAVNPDGQKLRIALIDDDASLCQTLAYVLDEIGHQVVAASSIKSILARLGQMPPDIMIADYRLGGDETGINAIAAVSQAFGKQIPSVILTGETAPEMINKIADHQVLVLHKPVKLEALTEKMTQLTRQPTLEHLGVS